VASSSFLLLGRQHECVALPTEKRTGGLLAAPLANEEKNCYEHCGKASGFCSFCGVGNACCDGWSRTVLQECRGITTNRSDYSCAAAKRNVPEPGASDFGCFISFRGTKSTANGLVDANFLPSGMDYGDCEGCGVFSGFWNVWQDIEDKVMATLADNGCLPGGRLSSLLLTGHSMGGALATLAMYTMQMRGYSVAPSYNFESTRVGTVEFGSTFKRAFSFHPPLFRITNGKDPVPHMPPGGMFRHVGTEVFFPAEGGERVVCEEEEDARCAGRYNVFDTVAHSSVHCQSVLVKSGDICTCPYWQQAPAP